MKSKNTLRVSSGTYKNYCKDKGLMISRQFEIMMEKQMITKEDI